MRHRNDVDTLRSVAAAAALGCTLVLVWAFLIATPVYMSKTEILVRPAAAPAFEGTSSRGAEVNPGHERELVHSGRVAQLAKQNLETTATVADLRSRLGVSAVGGTNILDLSFRAPTRSEAQLGAAAYAAAYLELKRQQVEVVRDQRRATIGAALAPIEEDIASARRTLGSTGPATADGIATRARVDDLVAQAAPYRADLAATDIVDPYDVGSVVSPATRPGAPAHPKPVLAGLAGAILGAALGAALVVGRDRIDRRVLGREDLEEHLGAPVLATVPRVRRRPHSAGPVTLEQPDSRAADAYRALRVRLLALARKRPLRTVLVASPAGNDTGTATVAANLAASLTQVGKEVSLVSAGAGALDAAGSLPLEAMRRLLADRERTSDFVVVEAPPVLDTGECLALAPLVDAVVVVAALRSSTRDDVALARQQLDEVGAEVVGGVLSNVRTAGPIH